MSTHYQVIDCAMRFDMRHAREAVKAVNDFEGSTGVQFDEEDPRAIKELWSALGFEICDVNADYAELEACDAYVTGLWDWVFPLLAPYMADDSLFGVHDEYGSLFGWKFVDGKAQLLRGNITWELDVLERAPAEETSCAMNPN